MVPAGSPGAGTTPMPFAGQAYVRLTRYARNNAMISARMRGLYGRQITF